MQIQRKNYSFEFKDEMVKQVTDKGHAIVDVAKRLGISEGFCTAGSKSSKNPMHPNQVTSRCCVDRLNSRQRTLPSSPGEGRIQSLAQRQPFEPQHESSGSLLG